MFCLLQFTKLKDEFGAVYFDLLSSESDSDFEMLDYDCEGTVEGEWVNVVRTRSYKEAASVEITRNRGGFSSSNRSRRAKPERCFSSVISSMRLLGDDCLINFDTTALVALVSGITNGCAERIVNMPEIELEEKFKGNTVFDCSGVI